ncbi:MAG: PaaI family thioesterase [Cellvibrionaceae bacterium]
MSDKLLDFGKQVLDSQPFSKLLGAELTHFEKNKAELQLVIKDEHKQQHGFAHGGVVSYLADNCLTYAGGSILKNCLTSEYKINYLRPAIGEKLIARATVLSSGKSQAVCECKVYAVSNDEEKLVAAAQGTIVKVE